MQLIINITVYLSLLLVISSSYHLIYFTSKFFHLAHAAIITLGAYATFFFFTELSLPLPIAIVGAIIFAMIIGTSCNFLVYQRLNKKNSMLWHYLISSIGLYIILQNLISLVFGDDTKIINTNGVKVGHEILGAYITSIQIITIITSFILFIGFNVFLEYTSKGKSIKAVSNNPELSDIYGIDSKRTILIAFAIGSALAAIGGICCAMDTNLTPTFGFSLLLYGVIAMIIGGIGNSKTLIAGALLVAVVQNIGSYYITSKWVDSIAFSILIIFLIWKPLGFSGTKLKKIEI